MKYRILITLLLFAFFFSLYLTAHTLNEQLCIPAATVLDCRLAGDNLYLSVMNCEYTFKIPGLHGFREFALEKLISMDLKYSGILAVVEEEFYHCSVSLRNTLEHYYDMFLEFFAKDRDHGEV